MSRNIHSKLSDADTPTDLRIDRPPCIDPSDTLKLDPRAVPRERISSLEDLPAPAGMPLSGSLSGNWNSVALFFNLRPADQPGDYSHTTVDAAKEWMDEGDDPKSPDISTFMQKYWGTLSYGNFSFGMDTPRDDSGDPVVPTLSDSNLSSGDWRKLIKLHLDKNAERIWKAAGGLTRNGKRWIPSLVLVQNYWDQASAIRAEFTRTVDGEQYYIGDWTHIVFELEAHATEEIGYLAVGLPDGNGRILKEHDVADAWSTLDFNGTFTTKPLVLTTIQTYNGDNPAAVRIRNLSSSEVDVMIEEEESLDSETDHNPETLGYFAQAPGFITDSSNARVGEAGIVNTDQQGGDEWHTVNLNGSYSNPAVFMQLMSYEGHQPAHSRIRNVQPGSFEFQIEEWDYLNQKHDPEDIGYVVLERGQHRISGGTEIEVGTVQTNQNWKRVPLSMSGHQEVVVLSNTQTRNGDQAVVTRQRNVSSNDFEVRLQEEESNHRRFWSAPLAHEYAHNFLEFGDLYGPAGSTLYWDLLGDASVPARMSEVSSVHKERIGWLEYKEVIEGPTQPELSLSLDPYTTSGEAYKIIPDPENNPHEYFVLEYRKSTGSEVWRPDGGLVDEGLFITHINDRFGIPGNWLLRDAPYFDPEYAGASDEGATSRKGGALSENVCYPHNGHVEFVPTSMPSSDFYGDRDSGLRITNIHLDGGKVKFDLGIWGASQRRLWHTAPPQSEVRIEEEESSDSETRHDSEDLDFFAAASGTVLDDQNRAIGEAATLTMGQDGSQWRTVSLDRRYSDPVVLAQIMSYEGSDPSHVRLDKVKSDSFRLKIEEWDYLDGDHNEEEIGYVVLEQGSHTLKGGMDLQVGTVETDHEWKKERLDGFGEKPVVISRCQTYEGEQAVVTRHKQVGNESFRVRLQEEEGNNGHHREEEIGYLAIERGEEDRHLAGSQQVDHNWEQLNFGGAFDGRPVTVASLQTFRGGNTAGVRMRAAPTEDRSVVGRFTSSDRTRPEEIFIRDDDRAALLQTRESQWFAAHRQEDRIGEWNLRAQDRELAGDLDGDGRDEIYIRSNNWAGILEWTGRRFHTRTLTEDRVGEWNLREQDREYIGDFDGDGREEVFVRSNDWAGLIALENDDLILRYIEDDRIEEWDLRAQDRSHVGRFTQKQRDEIMVRSNNWIGLLEWDNSSDEMQCAFLMSGSVGQWNLGSDDEHAIGDFDGDGLDEIYIRSDNWAGVIKWKNGRFELLWIQSGSIPHMSNGSSLSLDGSDNSYAGRFLPNPIWSPDSTQSPRPGRDGILNVKRSGTDKPFAVLTWENGAMRVRFDERGGNLEWSDRENRVAIGDFHKRGPDVALEKKDFQGDRADDVFVHNGWGTGMIGVNHVEFNPIGKPGDIRSEMSITWKQRDYLLSREAQVDCLYIDLDQLQILDGNDGFTLADDTHRILYDEERSVIERCREIIDHYGMNRNCYVGRPNSSMMYFLVDGEAPEGAFPGENGISFDPDELRIEATGKGWELRANGETIVTCRQIDEAHRAYAIIQEHGFTKKCWVDEPGGVMTYYRK